MAADVEHFSQIPWCAAHMKEPGTIVMPVPSRTPKSSGEDSLFARTLAAPSCITGFIALYKPPAQERRIVDDVTFLIGLERGLAGHADVCHGGIVATILDEVMGLIFLINRAHLGTVEGLYDGPYMTGQLNTTFLRPVALPGTYLCRVRIDRIEGRKVFVSAEMEGEQNVFAKGETLYIALKNKL